MKVQIPVGTSMWKYQWCDHVHASPHEVHPFNLYQRVMHSTENCFRTKQNQMPCILSEQKGWNPDKKGLSLMKLTEWMLESQKWVITKSLCQVVFISLSHETFHGLSTCMWRTVWPSTSTIIIWNLLHSSDTEVIHTLEVFFLNLQWKRKSARTCKLE